MKRPILYDLIDEAYEVFKKSEHYNHLVKPLKDKIQYPENYVRRIFDEAFQYGRISKMNHGMTTGEVITIQTRFFEWLKNRIKIK